jgi:hypothetical protein
VPDNADNCPLAANPDQTDADGDGLGAACDARDDDGDNDGEPDASDNCPKLANPDQSDGVDDLATVLDSPSLDLTGGLTIEAWVKAADVKGRLSILMKDGSEDLSYALYGADPSKPNVSVLIGKNTRRAQGVRRLAVGAWTHVAATFDGMELRLYLDGVPSKTMKGKGAITPSAGVLRLGGKGLWGELFAGVLDEIRIYDRALTAEQVQVDMLRPVATGTPLLP